MEVRKEQSRIVGIMVDDFLFYYYYFYLFGVGQ